MAFSASLSKRTVFGDLKVFFYEITDVQSGGSTLTVDGMDVILFGVGVNQTDKDEQMCVEWSGNVLTLTTTSNDDDGHIMVIGH